MHASLTAAASAADAGAAAAAGAAGPAAVPNAISHPSRGTTMGGKAKPTKHTAAEMKAKAHAATTNMGGGKAGLQDRKGGAVGHAKYMCPICKTAAPSLTSMQVCRTCAMAASPARYLGLPSVTDGQHGKWD